VRRTVLIEKYSKNKKTNNNNEEEEKEKCDPLFNIPSEWKPETSEDEEIEKALKGFKDAVVQNRARFMKPSPSNLMPSQFHTIEQL